MASIFGDALQTMTEGDGSLHFSPIPPKLKTDAVDSPQHEGRSS